MRQNWRGEIEKLHAGEDRRDSNVSHSNGNCLGPVFLQHFVMME